MLKEGSVLNRTHVLCNVHTLRCTSNARTVVDGNVPSFHHSCPRYCTQNTPPAAQRPQVPRAKRLNLFAVAVTSDVWLLTCLSGRKFVHFSRLPRIFEDVAILEILSSDVLRLRVRLVC